MTGNWQDVAALLVVLAAALYLARGLVFRRRRAASGGCATGGCGSCSMNRAAKSAAPQTPITIGRPERSSR